MLIKRELSEASYVEKSSRKSTSRSTNKIKNARIIKLKPVGYPIKDNSRPLIVEIVDEKLFEIYAKEQWIGSIVEINDYLFDQRLIPDYAFRVVYTEPKGRVKITENTRILIENEYPLPPYIIRVEEKISFEDIIGQDEAKRKCKIVLEYLKNPKRFGEFAPKNILFHGPPGTGKTSMAKALASNANVTMLMIRATDLIGEYVGDAARKIHELYKIARAKKPCIIFIDEFDAIALDRRFQALRGDVSEIVNAILSEMDGLRNEDGIVTIAATNNISLLDIAIRNRFEIEIEFKMPDEKERYKILKHYCDKLPLEVKANLYELAKLTEGLSPREIKEKIIKEAFHIAISENSSYIKQEHFIKALKLLKRDINNVHYLYR